jgi:hypothetical protein
MKRRQTLLLHVGIALALAAALTGTPTAQSGGEPETFTALAVNMGNVGPSQPTTVDITIARWSTDDERTRLVTTLVEQGAAALLEALRENQPVGRIRTPDSVGYELRYAHQSPHEGGGRRIVIATDRPIGFWEARERPRTAEYPFTVIEMRINPNGKGEGKLSLATKVVPVGKTIYLEDYATQPVMLTNVQARKRAR